MSYGCSKSNLTELDKLQSLIVNYQLEFENYEDNYGLNIDTFKDINFKFHSLQYESSNMTEVEKINLSYEILSDYQNMINSLPEDHKNRFIFNNDKTITYNWNNDIIK